MYLYVCVYTHTHTKKWQHFKRVIDIYLTTYISHFFNQFNKFVRLAQQFFLQNNNQKMFVFDILHFAI